MCCLPKEFQEGGQSVHWLSCDCSKLLLYLFILIPVLPSAIIYSFLFFIYCWRLHVVSSQFFLLIFYLTVFLFFKCVVIVIRTRNLTLSMMRGLISINRFLHLASTSAMNVFDKFMIAALFSLEVF